MTKKGSKRNSAAISALIVHTLKALSRVSHTTSTKERERENSFQVLFDENERKGLISDQHFDFFLHWARQWNTFNQSLCKKNTCVEKIFPEQMTRFDWICNACRFALPCCFYWFNLSRFVINRLIRSPSEIRHE